MPETHRSNFYASTSAISLKNIYIYIYIFITRKLHDIKFTVAWLSLISFLFIPCVSDEQPGAQFCKCTDLLWHVSA